ncbi:MAG: hypothetical protein QOH60_97 [Mycobacterium sp.]|jgi:hypothetical protein|nr:hypothetical protein [Mycobacterium sp.]
MMVTGVGREERRHFTGRRRRGVDWPSSHRPTVLSLAVLLVGGGIHAIAFAAPAHADATVMAKTQRMSEPSLTSQQDGWYNQGDKLTLNCFKRGQAVKGHFSFNIPNGGWDNLWYKVSDGHFVADVDIETGTLSTVTPECDQAPAPQASGAPGASLATKVDNFVAATNGHKVGDGQCVPLIKQYLSDVYGIQPGSWGNAIDYRQGGSAGNQLESRGFSWHTDRQFNNGDILVWQQDSRFAYLPQGHIAVGYNGKIYDQNYAGRLTAGSDPFSGYGYLGYWRKAL